MFVVSPASQGTNQSNNSAIDTYKLVRQIRKEIKKELAESGKDKDKDKDKKKLTFSFWEMVILVWAASWIVGPFMYYALHTLEKIAK